MSHDRLGGLLDAYPVMSLIKSLVDPFIVVMVLYAQGGYLHLQRSGPLLLVAILGFMAGVMLLDNTYLLLAESRDRSLGVMRFATSWGLLALFTEAVCKLAGWRFPEHFILSWLLITPMVILLTHFCFRCFFLRSPSYRGAMRRVLIVGANELGQTLAARLRSEVQLRLAFVGYVDDRKVERLSPTVADEVLGELAGLLQIIAQHRIDRIYVALPMTRQTRIVEMLDMLKDSTVSVYFVPDMAMCDLIQARLDHVAGIPVLGVRESPFLGLFGPIKRAEDLLLSLGILTLIWPLMLAVAMAVKLTSPGPILFVQRRYGVDGKSIDVYKFRSMTVMEDGDRIAQAVKGDRRLTRIGAFLRKTSLDELPQFFNVLKGQMSIVGPRPHANAHNELYRRLIKGYMFRHKVKPGITGWAQINGCRGETATVEQMRRRIDMDLEYIRNWSVWLDLKIVLRTARLVLKDPNAY
ncbi:undecaprenyl-phosphate glucose phosphotransferase [Paludibacterium purpuratum]|uniref:Putative colanic acid biosynthesis UDP-glucose lipid carrier transferase n=1 Tax=Paludibacterium purpuratum TaxID=1144873 RepID=A0A4R7B4P8_9NEIS|nr:undecaprenyl-phosphate glucose phosphotransferase [Paludibacterium purpuratum]TDR77823.1 putative colanic acid biosynthesis UDP-glucose lipid carrier transferase [Paludibacterium purpuratum]